MPSTIKLDLSGLINAITQATAEDSLSNPLNTADWNLLSAYIQPMTLAAGQTLFMQGASERTLYFVESGSLSVHYEDEKERLGGWQRRVFLAPTAQRHRAGHGALQTLEFDGHAFYRTEQPPTCRCPAPRHGGWGGDSQAHGQSPAPHRDDLSAGFTPTAVALVREGGFGVLLCPCMLDGGYMLSGALLTVYLT
jgi:hypothetical protein